MKSGQRTRRRVQKTASGRIRRRLLIGGGRSIPSIGKNGGMNMRFSFKNIIETGYAATKVIFEIIEE